MLTAGDPGDRSPHALSTTDTCTLVDAEQALERLPDHMSC
jgi:hypothetical protein